MRFSVIGTIGLSLRPRGDPPGTGPLPAQMKVIAMTTEQPRRRFARWVTAPVRAFRYLNDELSGAGGAMARSNRFPQPSPQADMAEAERVLPASAGLWLMGV
jgi:hypothetical protein